jgi:hypothetical protein
MAARLAGGRGTQDAPASVLAVRVLAVCAAAYLAWSGEKRVG